ncbi:protein app1-like [Helianthus annuus]|uniref:protein app1-like n=1 Tax=Helianthus annuus TaxID=4232 RepID=UPI000B8F3E69|nr:protein app1-like [Helianthus annuus]
MEFDDLEPAVAPEPVDAPVLALEHDLDHADAPAVAPLVDDVPVDDHPIVAPLLEDDPAVDAHIDAPRIADIPADPVVPPLPDPVPVQFDRAPFATHVGPRHGWTDDDNGYPPFEFPVTPPMAPVLAPVSVPRDTPLFPHSPLMLTTPLHDPEPALKPASTPFGSA